MKLPSIKKVVVKCANFWTDEIEIDADIFEDVYLEAATQAVEKRKNLKGFKLTVVLECWEKKDVKKPEKHFCYNTYRVMINAGLYGKAEILRLNFLSKNNIDLKVESLKGENEEGDNNGGKKDDNNTNGWGSDCYIPKPSGSIER